MGLNATDTVIPLSTYPTRGSKVEYGTAHLLPGGQAATTVIACQHWGMKTRYVGKIGDDDAGRLHRCEFARAGVDAQMIEVAGCASRQSLILVDGGESGNGERTVLWRRDERLDLAPQELRPAWIQAARALHVDGYDTAAAILAAGWARHAGVPVIADLDELYPSVHDLLHLTDYAIVSRDFPLRLMAETDLETALQRMQQRYACRLTAATLGEDGVLAWDGDRFHYSAAYRVPVVDTTGAGDIFHAGFIYGLLAGWPLSKQLDFAGASAALNCTAIGARGNIAPVSEILDLMQTGKRYPGVFENCAAASEAS